MQKINLGLVLILLIVACRDTPKKQNVNTKIDYDSIVKDVKSDSSNQIDISDSSNILDKNSFDPMRDSLNIVLDTLNNIYTRDSAMVKKLGINDSGILSQKTELANQVTQNDTFTNSIKKIQPDELKTLKFNLDQLHKADSSVKLVTNTRRQIERRVWARINKTNQRLYLYVDGQIVDTFKVSTGDKKHETPLLDRQPSGPIFQKYTSKKYPGGNYNGLGNMPHVVFIQGGYGVHGTTRGNIPKLGKKASHGCVRLHPDNAKIFNELVKRVGINNTWITIEN
jgi:lipoprotein-anchoring transpeptidase ErfK/SrfK